MPKHFQHACRFLRHDERIAGCLAAIERYTHLLREIRAVLPSPLGEHCLHASLDAGVLTLLTDSPVWSSRLRFFAPELEHQLTPRHGPIAACRVRVRPHASASSSKVSSNKLPATTVQHLMDTAAGIGDARLAAALRRLAKAGTRNR